MGRGDLEYLIPKKDRKGVATIKNLTRLRTRRIFIRCSAVAVLLIITLQVIQIYVNIQYRAIPQLFSSQSLTDIDELNYVKPVNDTSIRGYSRLECECNSNRSLSLQGPTSKSDSSCSMEATEFGTGQRVISYSLFVKEADAVPYFLDGVGPNVEKVLYLFPGWLVRMYTNIPINSHSCSLICRYDHLFWCDITNIPKLGNLISMNGRLWRFLPVGDPTVDIFISRDLDSLPSVRERIAVSEWERSDKIFHVIRDSQWHDTEILAGLWGAKNYLLDHNVASRLQLEIIEDGKENDDKSLDQKVLRGKIFNPYLDYILAHDSYYCQKYNETATVPFSTKRNGEEFVGHDDLKERGKIFVGRLQPCSESCRPFYGKDWKYC